MIRTISTHAGGALAPALDRDEKPARRRRQSCESVVRNSEPKDEAALKKDQSASESLAWSGLEVKGKTPVNLLNELGPKVFRCYPEFVTTTQQDAVNPYHNGGDGGHRHLARRLHQQEDVAADCCA